MTPPPTFAASRQPSLPAADGAPGLLDALSDAQREAAAPAPRVVVRGGAGAGKTTVIQARFDRLVADGTPPEAIATLVPGAARASALSARLARRLPGAYEELVVVTPLMLATRVMGAGGGERVSLERTLLGPGDRLALLVESIDELSLRHHDLGGRPTALLRSFVRRIDRLKGELVGAERYRDWAAELDPATDSEAERHREFAEIYLAHERLLARAGARDEGDLVAAALALARRRPAAARGGLRHLLVDDAQELDLATASLVRALAGAPADASLLVAGDPDGGLRGPCGAGAQRLDWFAAGEDRAREVELAGTRRCPAAVWRARGLALDADPGPAPADAPAGGEVALWRCANDRSQVQAVATDVQRLVAREGVDAGAIAVIVPEVRIEGQAVGVALAERAISHRVVGDAVFFQRAEIRDLLAWLRLLADPTDAAAVVRALARAPITLRSVDIARCTQIARRRKLDMVAALVAALESPQVPPDARDRIRTFLSLYRACTAALDSSRPDLFVHRLIDRLGLRRQQLFAAQADDVERLQGLAAFGELAAAHAARAPQATARDFARSVAAVAEVGLGREEEPELDAGVTTGERRRGVQILAAVSAGGLEAEHVYVIGLHASLRAPASEPIPDALASPPPGPAPDGPAARERALRQQLALACGRSRRRLVLAYPRADDRGEAREPAPLLEEIRHGLGAVWQDREEELFGPAEALHATYRLMRDELLDGTMRAAGRLGELRLDTDLDISHAVVRYLELLKVAALLSADASGDGDGSGDGAGARPVADALRDINARIGQAVTAEQREIFETSALDDYLLDAERDARARAQALAARDEPSLAAFLPLRGDGVALSASDIDTYRACPLRYKFARVFRIPQEPTLHQRFGILIHQVLERYHGGAAREEPARTTVARTPTLPELLGLLDAGWRRGGFGDSQAERQLRGKATAALTRYHERFASERAQPIWFERQFSFTLGRNLLRGRVDRVDRLPGGEYELIDYKTGRPKDPVALADDVQLSLYAVGAREAWKLEASRQAYYYLLDDEKVAVPDDGDRAEWIGEVVAEVADGIRSQDFEPTPSISACGMCDYRLICPAAER